ncbi:MOG interacting and ectopic P-granules protein 1-like [Haliotis asinina]|uniref:MOG interacting and ectopic P-granules protein 1-like n=1 Tax=Haliotis asinina TaxID=109174 RepID=UPI003531B016
MDAENDEAKVETPVLNGDVENSDPAQVKKGVKTAGDDVTVTANSKESDKEVEKSGEKSEADKAGKSGAENSSDTERTGVNGDQNARDDQTTPNATGDNSTQNGGAKDEVKMPDPNLEILSGDSGKKPDGKGEGDKGGDNGKKPDDKGEGDKGGDSGKKPNDKGEGDKFEVVEKDGEKNKEDKKTDTVKGEEEKKDGRTESAAAESTEKPLTESSPPKNLRKRKSISNGYKEAETSDDEDYKDMIIEKKQKKEEPPKMATERSVSVPAAALKPASQVVPLAYNVGQPLSLLGASILPSQQATVRMVIPSVQNALLTQSGGSVILSQPQTSFQGLTLNSGVVLYPHLQAGSTSAVMSTMMTTGAQKGSIKTTPGISIVGVTNSKKSGAVTSVTSSKHLNKVDKVDLRPPSNSFEMIELVKWELKQGIYHRPKNFKLKPDSELGAVAKFLRDFGQDLVKESVYSDLVRIQNKRSNQGKLTDKEKQDFHKLKSVHVELKDKVGPVKLSLSKKCKCGFQTESENVMFWHKQHPHMTENDLRCAHCEFETRNSSAFSFHMEAEHSTKARFLEKPPFWECNLCPYENNLRNKLTQHKFRCIKTFKLNLNLHPSWMPGPEINYCLEKTFYKNPLLININRLQQQQQQQQQQNQQQRAVTPIMPKGQVVQSGNQVVKTIPYGQMNKGPVVNTQAFKNPALLAKLGQGQSRTAFQPRGTLAPNVNLFRGQNAQQFAVKGKTNVTYVRPPNTNVSNKINNIISMNTHVLDKGSSASKPNSGFEVCEICGGYVKDRTALRIHFFYAHRIDMPHGVFDRVHPPLYCATCFARFWTAQGLQKHLDVHKEDSSGGVAGKCIVCLHRVPNILMHMKIVHNKAFVNFLRECKCIFCGTKCSNKSVVESHMAAVHGVVVKSGSQPDGAAHTPPQARQKPVNPKTAPKSGKNDNQLVKGSVCVLCNLNFGRNVDLTRHCMRVHHTCMKCGMVVADKESLLRHTCLESPSGLRNCEICKEKGFHPAYHVKHIRDKHLRKLSIKLKRLDEKITAKFIKKPIIAKPQKMPAETIELSDDDEPATKRMKTNQGEKVTVTSKVKTKKYKSAAPKAVAVDDVVMLSDDEEDEKGVSVDKEKSADDKVNKSKESEKAKNSNGSKVLSEGDKKLSTEKAESDSKPKKEESKSPESPTTSDDKTQASESGDKDSASKDSASDKEKESECKD